MEVKYNMRIRNSIIGALLIVGLLLVPLASASTTTTTFTFVVPSNIAHTLSYGGSCSTSAFYFVGDASGDGTNLVPRDAASGGSACQSTTPGLTINNGGNVAIDVTGEFASLPAGVTVWTADTNGGAEVQSWTSASTSAKQIAATIAASGTHETWVYANLTSFNSGVAGQQTGVFTTTASS
jgi:hypothetical protein